MRKLRPKLGDVLLCFFNHVPSTESILEPDVAYFDILLGPEQQKIILSESELMMFVLCETQS